MKKVTGFILVLLFLVCLIQFSYAARYYCPPPNDYYYYYPERVYRQHSTRSYYRPGYYRYSPRIGRHYYYKPYSETWATSTVTDSTVVVDEIMY